MNTLLKFFLVFGFVFLFTNNALAAKKLNAEPIDAIVAQVNDGVITQSEVDLALSAITRQLIATHAPVPSTQDLRKKVIEQLVNRKVELQLAEQVGIHPTDAEINKAIGRIAADNKVSVPELYEKLKSEDLSVSDYKKEIRDELALQRLQQQEVGAKITINPDDVKNFMKSKAWQNGTGPVTKEYYLEDILIPLPETASASDIEKAKNQANLILTQLHQGASAKTINGSSDLGWRKLAEIPSAFANQVTQMKKNELSTPIQTANGFHIIHLTDVRDTAVDPNAPLPTKKLAEQMVFQQKFEVALQHWLAKMRSQAIINLHPENT